MSAGSRGRLLIVAHHFPPDFTIGSFRPRRMAMALRGMGWDVEVLSARPLYFEGTDEDLCRGLEDVPVHRTHAFGPRAWLRSRRGASRSAPASAAAAPPAAVPTPGGPKQALVRAARWLSLRLEIPDEWFGWIPFAIARGVRLTRPTVVLATAPAFSNFIVGAVLARRFGAPLVLDYRDPWNPLARRGDLPPSRRRIEATLERWCVGRAAGLVTTTPGLAEEISDLCGRPVGTVTNACEPERFAAVEAASYDVPTLVYAGGLYGDRTLVPVLEALAGLVRSRALRPGSLRVLYMGRTPEAAAAPVERLGLDAFVEIHGVRPNADALSAMLGASCNLAIVGREHARQIPAKIFEQIAARRSMLVIGPPDSDTEALLRDVPYAQYVVTEDREGLEHALAALADAGADPPVAEIPRSLSVEATMQRLEEILESAVAGRGG